MLGFGPISSAPISAIQIQYPYINWLPVFPYQIQPPIPAAYSFFTHNAIDEVLNLPVPFLPRIADATPIIAPDKPNYFTHALPLNLPIKFLPRLPDVAAPVLPPGYVDFSSPILPLNFKLNWLSLIVPASPIILSDKPNAFMPRWLVNLPIPWLSRTIEAAPVTLPDKPNVFSPTWALNFFLKWLPEVYTAAPPSSVPPEGAIVMPVLPLNLPIAWLSKTIDAPPIVPPDRQSVFSNIFPLKLSTAWFSKIFDAPVILQVDKPNYFAPKWLLNILIDWLPENYTAAPGAVTPPEGMIASPIFPLNFRLPWLSRVVDAPPVIPADKPSVFSPRWLLFFPLSWLPARISDAPPLTLADKPNYFAPEPSVITKILSWFPRIGDAIPLVRADRPSVFSNILPFNFKLPWFPRITHAEPPSHLPPDAITVLPEPDIQFGDIGRLIRLGRRNRNLPVEFKSDIVPLEQNDETLELSPLNSSISPARVNRLI